MTRKSLSLRALISAILLIMVNLSYGDAPNPDYKKGLQFYGEKKFLLAIGSFRKAIEAGVQDAKLNFYLGNAYVSNDDLDKAIEQYRLASELADKPEFQGIIQHNIAYALYLKKDYKKSIEGFNKAFSTDSKLVQTYWFKGLSYYRLKDKTNTISEWENYLVAAPEGRESDNIRKALAILKSSTFSFDKDKIFPDDGKSGNGGSNGGQDGSDSSRAQKAPDVQPLIDIEGVLEEIKPTDKGKVTDDSLEEIER